MKEGHRLKNNSFLTTFHRLSCSYYIHSNTRWKRPRTNIAIKMLNTISQLGGFRSYTSIAERAIPIWNSPMLYFLMFPPSHLRDQETLYHCDCVFMGCAGSEDSGMAVPLHSCVYRDMQSQSIWSYERLTTVLIASPNALIYFLYHISHVSGSFLIKVR